MDEQSLNPPQPTDSNEYDSSTMELIEQARSGDLNAYEALFEEKMSWVLLYIDQRLGRKLRSKLESMDVLQETFLEAHSRFSTFKIGRRGSFSKWLCQIAETTILRQAEWFGAQKRAPEKELRARSTLLAHMATMKSSPGTRAARNERHETLANALQDLEEKETQVILMRYFQGLKINFIAERLDCNPRTVKRLIIRANSRLGEVLSELNN